MSAIQKYPRTHHIEGSRLQPGDEDLDSVPLSELAGRPLVIEEKIDGSNTGISFGPDGALRLQSRGNYLCGGPRELQYDLLKAWAQCHCDVLRDTLGDRYVLYGEWAFAKHTVFYDSLAHYFLEFDILDLQRGVFLSTRERRKMLRDAPVVSVPVVYTGTVEELDGGLHGLVGRSLFRSEWWREALESAAREAGQDPELVREQTDLSDRMEGLYIKVEEDGEVTARYKFVRTDFLTVVDRSETHWIDRPIVANRLSQGVDLFAV